MILQKRHEAAACCGKMFPNTAAYAVNYHPGTNAAFRWDEDIIAIPLLSGFVALRRKGMEKRLAQGPK